MALNPAFADASINPSQSMGNDASVNPTQGALPTGAPATQNTGATVLGQQDPMPQFDFGFTRWDPNDPKNLASYQPPQQDTYGFDATGNYVGVNTPTGGFNPFGNRIDTPMQPDYIGQPATQEVPDYQMPMSNDQPFPQYGFGVPSPFMNQGANQGMALTEFPDGRPNLRGVYANAGVEGWYNQPGAPTFEEWQANPSLATEFQNNQAQQPNPALQPPTEFVGQLPNLPLQQDAPSRYTYFGNEKNDYSQLGLSQTALDHLKMMSGAQDAGQFYYDTQTKTFNQGAGRGPNPRPGQRVYTGMSNIPLDVMNKLGSGEEIDFSPYRQYTEGTPLPPTLQDIALQEPMPEQQPGPTPPLAPQQPVQQPQVLNGVTGTPANPLTPTAPTGTTPMATNPLSQVPVAPAAAYTPAPNVGTASSGGGSFTQGAPLPNITTTQQQVTAAPAFYTDYLNQLAKQGASTAQNAQYVGATDLQNQAFNQTAQNVGNYQPALQSAINMAQNVGDSNLYKAVGELGQANIARNLAPQATAGIVGSGQFGSKRGAAALGDTIANAQLGITAQQAQALQQDMQNRIAAAQQLGNLASTTQQLGLGDINALATMGGQKQTIAQNEQLFPMQQLTNQSQLLRGYTIPTSTGSSYTGPIPGAYAASPLQQIAGLGALGAGISQTNLGTAIGKLFGGATDASTGALSKLLGINVGGTGAVTDVNGNTSTPTIPDPNSIVGLDDETGGYITSDGNIIDPGEYSLY